MGGTEEGSSGGFCSQTGGEQDVWVATERWRDGWMDGPVDGVSDPHGGRGGGVDRHTSSLMDGWESWQMVGGGVEGWKGRWKHSWM